MLVAKTFLSIYLTLRKELYDLNFSESTCPRLDDKNEATSHNTESILNIIFSTVHQKRFMDIEVTITCGTRREMKYLSLSLIVTNN